MPSEGNEQRHENLDSQEPEPSTELQGGENQPQQSAPDPAPRGLRGSGLRYSEADGVEEWAVGKTADEILQMTASLYKDVQRLSSAPPQNNTTSAPVATNAPDPFDIDENLLYTQPKEVLRRMKEAAVEAARAEVRQAAPQVMGPIAGMVKTQARSYRPDIWKRYGPEIESTMAQVHEQLRADLDVWHKAIDMVAGQHVDEIARSMAEDMVSKGSLDTGSPTGASTGITDPKPASGLSPIHRLFATNDPAIKPYREQGLTADDVIEHARKMGVTEERRAKQLQERVSVQA